MDEGEIEVTATEDAAVRRNPPLSGGAIASGCIGPDAGKHGSY